MHQTLRYHIDNRAYRFEINNIQYSLVILVQWRSILKTRNLMRLERIPEDTDAGWINDTAISDNNKEASLRGTKQSQICRAALYSSRLLRTSQ